MAYKSKAQEHQEKLESLIELANTPDDELKKMTFKEKQKVFNAKNKLCRVAWNTKEQGQFINHEKQQKKKEKEAKKKAQKS